MGPDRNPNCGFSHTHIHLCSSWISSLRALLICYFPCYFSELGDLSTRLEKTIKDLDNVKAQAQQTEDELRDELEKQRENVGRKDRDMQVGWKIGCFENS